MKVPTVYDLLELELESLNQKERILTQLEGDKLKDRGNLLSQESFQI